MYPLFCLSYFPEKEISYLSLNFTFSLYPKNPHAYHDKGKSLRKKSSDICEEKETILSMFSFSFLNPKKRNIFRVQVHAKNHCHCPVYIFPLSFFLFHKFYYVSVIHESLLPIRLPVFLPPSTGIFFLFTLSMCMQCLVQRLACALFSSFYSLVIDKGILGNHGKAPLSVFPLFWLRVEDSLWFLPDNSDKQCCRRKTNFSEKTAEKMFVESKNTWFMILLNLHSPPKNFHW